MGFPCTKIRLKISVRRLQLEKGKILCIVLSHCIIAVRLYQRNCCDFPDMLYESSKQYPKSDTAISHLDTLGRVHTLT